MPTGAMMDGVANIAINPLAKWAIDHCCEWALRLPRAFTQQHNDSRKLAARRRCFYFREGERADNQVIADVCRLCRRVLSHQATPRMFAEFSKRRSEEEMFLVLRTGLGVHSRWVAALAAHYLQVSLRLSSWEGVRGRGRKRLGCTVWTTVSFENKR